MTGFLLEGKERLEAIQTIRAFHYTHTVPSGKSHYIAFGDALVVWSIPANKNIANFLLGKEASCWELSRLWAPDGHDRNLLTRAISAAVGILNAIERPAVLVSYADPNVGHEGFVYRAASWVHHGKSEEVRSYQHPDGRIAARRAFHSGKKGMTKGQIESAGWVEVKLPGKIRFVKPISRFAKKKLAQKIYTLGDF